MAVNNQANTNQRSVDETYWLSVLNSLSINELERVISYMENWIEIIEIYYRCKISSEYKELLEALREYVEIRKKYDVFIKPIERLSQIALIYKSLPEVVRRRHSSNLTKLEEDISKLVDKAKEYNKAKIESENRIYSIISKYPWVKKDLDIAIAEIVAKNMQYTSSSDTSRYRIAMPSKELESYIEDYITRKKNIYRSKPDDDRKRALSYVEPYIMFRDLPQYDLERRLVQKCKPLG